MLYCFRSRQEAENILKKTIYEVLVYQDDKVVPFRSSYTLRGMDQIMVLVDPPPPSSWPCLRTSFFESINISYPAHKLIRRNSEELNRQLRMVNKSALNMAKICLDMTRSTPVVEEGNLVKTLLYPKHIFG